ncbi:MAG: hypothetical protein FWG59_00995 [Betaproteobacteria bacterium]|nr:hypothetical protein [Betaproteobacteria bacterium]
MRIYSLLTVLAFSLLLCAGCGKREISLPGDTPVYTVSCDNTLDDCYTGAKMLCNGPYELASTPLPGKKATLGSFGWVDSSGEQQDLGSGGGRFSIRIRCK